MVDSGLTFKDIKWLITMLTAGVLSILSTVYPLMFMGYVFDELRGASDVILFPLFLIIFGSICVLAAAVWWYTLGALLKLFGIDEKRRPLPRKK